MRARIVLLVLAWVALVLLPGAGDAAAQAGAGLSFAAPGSGPYEVKLKWDDGSKVWRATIAAIVRNDSTYAKGVKAEFTQTGTSAVAGVTLESVLPAQVGPFATFTAVLTFTVAGTGEKRPDAFEGVIVLSASESAEVPPATLHVKVTTAAPPTTVPVFEPGSLTIGVTRPVPFWLEGLFGAATPGSAGPAAWLRGPIPAASPSSAYLLSENGTVLELLPTIVTVGPGQGQTTFVPATLPRPGKYQGTFVADPTSDKSPKLALTVTAQDAIYWPLLVLLIGALIPFTILKSRDRWRPKDLLKIKVKEVVGSYLVAQQKLGAVTPPYDYAALFRGDARDCPGYWQCLVTSWIAHLQHLKTAMGQSPSLVVLLPKEPEPKTAARLYCAVTLADSREALDQLANEIGDLGSRVQLWPKICEAHKKLTDDLTAASGLAALPIGVATKKLLDGTKAPGTAAGAEKLLASLKQQRDAITLYITAQQALAEVRMLYEGLWQRQALLTVAERVTLHQQDPDAIFQVYLRPATTLTELVEGGGIARLQEAWRVLIALDRAYPLPLKRALPGAADMLPEVELPDWLQQFLVIAVEPFQDRRTVEQLVGDIRRRDRFDFALTALLTAVAFVLTLYVGKNFGSWEQYLGAFIAGAAGTLVINWTLLPWYRSYRPAEPKKAGA